MIYLLLISTALVCLMVILAGRWKRCVAGAVVSAALVAGCATTPTGPVRTFACAPEGLPILDSTWQAVDTRTGMATRTETGVPVRMTMVGLAQGEKALLLIFIGDELVLVDLNPLDPGVPILANARLVTPQGKIRAEPDGPCVWHELLTGEST